MTDILVNVEDLEVSRTDRSQGHAPIVTGVSLTVRRGEVVAIVGESGSGKSTVCQAIIGLLASNLACTAGSIRFEDVDVETISDRRRRALRGRRIGMVFQDPLAALNPVRRIGAQLAEARRIHGLQRRREAREWARTTLADLGFKDPRRTMRAYPHTLSGGMRQRVCIGIAFSAEPSLVVADEPTTALDVSLQGRILRLLLAYAERLDSAILLVSHDIAVVRAAADRIVVMYAGRVLESGPARDVLDEPRSPYTAALLASLPRLDPAVREQDLVTIPSDAGWRTNVGCPFVGRCSRSIDRCREEFPDPAVEGEHTVWCWNPVPGRGPT